MSFRAAAILLAMIAVPAVARAPITVTRFHLDRDVPRGSVSAGGGVTTLERQLYDTAVLRELARLGFAAGGADARYIVVTDVTRDERPGARRGSGLSIGIGGGSFGRGGGVGVGGSIGLGGGPHGTVVTRLSVQLRERGSGGVVWEGRAEAEASMRSRDADPANIAARLASGLFRDFPGESGRTMRVR